MNKTILRYGLLSGLVAAILMVCTALYFHQTMNFDYGQIIGYVGILLSMLFVFFGVRAYRDQTLGHAFGFGKAFQVGLLITLISCALYVVAWLIVYETLMPDFMDKFIEHALGKMRASGASEAEVQAEMAKMQEMKTMYQNPLIRAMFTFLEPFPVGLLVTLISAAVLRKRPVAG